MKHNHHDLPWPDIIEWDIHNWSQAPQFWLANTQLNLPHCYALELGSRDGGMSLFLALKGMRVVCSDLNGPKDTATKLHKKYNVDSQVTYAAVNALSVPYPDAHFDIVVFKSVLGVLATYANQVKMIQEVYRVLKPGGELWFAENMAASPLHMLARKWLIKWSKGWRYPTEKEFYNLCGQFKQLHHISYGCLATFGRSESQRKVLSKIDRMMDRCIPSQCKYIFIGVARK